MGDTLRSVWIERKPTRRLLLRTEGSTHTT